MAFDGLGIGIAAARIEGDFARQNHLADYDSSIFGLTGHYAWSDFNIDAAIAYGSGSPTMSRVRTAAGANETLAVAGDVDLAKLKLTVEDLEHFGPTLIVDHKDRSGARVLVWSQ